MNNIIFDNVVPQIFRHTENLSSDIWSGFLEFEKGKLYLVEAESGKGKSTFCSYILGYRNDYSGTISFDGTDIRSYRVSDWVRVRQRNVSHLFQELRLFPELTAWENVQIKNNISSAGHTSEEQIKIWFDMLGIGDKLDAKIGKMSFGQQQRVAMLRALVQPFDFLLVDEPISHLDDSNSRIMGEIMLSEARRQEAAVIVTSIGKRMELPYDTVIRL
ncbi:MAG: ATP-binding cassette domain-containing protein [Bacteroidales bacterium]|nr:ATP-binding cassette domain-containing protein [Bacteroidales bacterium]MCM1147957.1 ATP-binding cassette domain-containing protein [Bacteroidales bacterium]MCM1206881.1 ATP-binding cassette domain-containing protein [Bacillota bacterium]MCM1509514.1 ATP-binding cassette domain-containing protein [Clostridium sp.]